MKKILSLVLSLALVFGSFGSVFADEAKKEDKKAMAPKDVVGTNYEEPVAALVALGVVNGYEDGTFKPEKVVTRAEMAKLIITELGLADNAKGYNASFKDLSGYNWATGFIGYAQSLGIINGYGDGRFGPADPVTHDQALTMVVRALGYTKDCKEMNGQWPAIYIQKARVLDLTDGVKAGGAIGANRGDIAMYMFNALTANMGYADKDGVYQKKEDKDGNPVKVIQTLGAELKTTGTGNQKVTSHLITDGDANNSIINIRKYVGQKAEIFEMRKGDREGDIVALGNIDSKVARGILNEDQDIIEDVDGTEYKLKDVNTDSVAYFENGVKSNDKYIKNIGKDTMLTLAGKLGGKTFKKNELHSISKWEVSAFAAIKKDEIKDITSDHKLLGYEFKENYDEKIDMTSFELEGVASLEDIKEGNIVYVYANNDKKITKVAVASKTVEGKVTKTKNDGKKIYIDGKAYKYAKEQLANNGTPGKVGKGDIEAGDEVKLMLDAYGYIYDKDLISGGASNYAIAIESGAGAGIGAKNELKLVLADGTSKVFKINKDAFKTSKFKDKNKNSQWDDTEYPMNILKKGAGFSDNFTLENVTADKPVIIKYGLNKDGEINQFGNIEVKPENAIKKISKTGRYMGYYLSERAMIVSGDLKANKFTQDEDDYKVVKRDTVLDTDVKRAMYVLDDSEIVAMLIADAVASDAVYGIVTDFWKTASDEYGYKMLIDGVEKEYKADSDYSSFKNDGELYEVKFRSNGEIKSLTKFAENNGEYTYKEVITKVSDNFKYEDRRFKDNGKDLGIESKLYVYKNDGGDYVKGSESDLRNNVKGKMVTFYDTLDDDGNKAYNVVIIGKDGFNYAPELANVSVKEAAIGNVGKTKVTLPAAGAENEFVYETGEEVKAVKVGDEKKGKDKIVDNQEIKIEAEKYLTVYEITKADSKVVKYKSIKVTADKIRKAPTLTLSTKVVNEDSGTNDGSIKETVEVTINDGEFKNTLNTANVTVDPVKGLPAGLTHKIQRNSDTKFTISFENSANPHTEMDKVVSFKIAAEHIEGSDKEMSLEITLKFKN